jgi:hypothetical protein
MYLPVYTWFFQLVSCRQVSPPKSLMHIPSAPHVVQWNEVMWSEVKWWYWVRCLYYHWFIVMWLYVGSMQYVVALLVASVCYLLITRLMGFNILFMFLFRFVLCCVWFLLLCFPFPIFVQVYRPLPPGGNPTAVNKYNNNNNNHIIPDLITQIIFSDECRSWRFSLSGVFPVPFLFPPR